VKDICEVSKKYFLKNICFLDKALAPYWKNKNHFAGPRSLPTTMTHFHTIHLFGCVAARHILLQILKMRSVRAVEVGCRRYGHGCSGAIEDKTPSTCINL
jgi:hypothetical protein